MQYTREDFKILYDMLNTDGTIRYWSVLTDYLNEDMSENKFEIMLKSTHLRDVLFCKLKKVPLYINSDFDKPILGILQTQDEWTRIIARWRLRIGK